MANNYHIVMFRFNNLILYYMSNRLKLITFIFYITLIATMNILSSFVLAHEQRAIPNQTESWAQVYKVIFVEQRIKIDDKRTPSNVIITWLKNLKKQM